MGDGWVNFWFFFIHVRLTLCELSGEVMGTQLLYMRKNFEIVWDRSSQTDARDLLLTWEWEEKHSMSQRARHDLEPYSRRDTVWVGLLVTRPFNVVKLISGRQTVQLMKKSLYEREIGMKRETVIA